VKQVGQLKNTISNTFFKYGKKNLILTAIPGLKNFPASLLNKASQNLILTAVHWTKTCGPWLTENWNSNGKGPTVGDRQNNECIQYGNYHETGIKSSTWLQQINQNNTTCITFMWNYKQTRKGGLIPLTFWQFIVKMHTPPIPDHSRTKMFPASNKPKWNCSKLFYCLFRSYSYVFSPHLTVCMSICKDECCLAELKG
jgi:hypothetical protein